MTSITGSLYNTLNAYTSSLTSTTKDSDSDSSATKETTTTSTSTSDKVSLSYRVTTAQAREYHGLSATGILSLSDFETAAAEKEETVSTQLAKAMKSLGISSDQEVSLSLNNDGDITIAEKFEGKDDLEDLLNQDKTFVQAFSGLSSNNEVLSYVDSLTSTSISLMDYMNSDTNDQDLFALASKYATIKAADSIEDLWRLSHSQTPYTYTYNTEK